MEPLTESPSEYPSEFRENCCSSLAVLTKYRDVLEFHISYKNVFVDGFGRYKLDSVGNDDLDMEKLNGTYAALTPDQQIDREIKQLSRKGVMCIDFILKVNDKEIFETVRTALIKISEGEKHVKVVLDQLRQTTVNKSPPGHFAKLQEINNSLIEIQKEQRKAILVTAREKIIEAGMNPDDFNLDTDSVYPNVTENILAQVRYQVPRPKCWLGPEYCYATSLGRLYCNDRTNFYKYLLDSGILGENIRPKPRAKCTGCV